MNVKEAFFSTMLDKFEFVPTECQSGFLEMFSKFISDDQAQIYLLNGYAGTGKTTLVKAIVEACESTGIEYDLMAPTGRAAKVLSSYTGKLAQTIHRSIYYTEKSTSGGFGFKLMRNKIDKGLFIVDEASMISGSMGFGTQNLLDDLLQYVYSGYGNKLLIIGDVAQLPPVGMTVSPALRESYYKQSLLSGNFYRSQLKTVTRQNDHSGILYNATKIRMELWQNTFDFLIEAKDFSDVHFCNNTDIMEDFDSALSKYGENEVMIITRSNKIASAYNQSFRNHVLQMEGEIAAAERMMIVKNNYHWLKEDNSGGFLANGDIVVINRVQNQEEKYGAHFIDAEIELVDSNEGKTVEVKILMDSLRSLKAAMDENDLLPFHSRLEQDYEYITSRSKKWIEIKNNAYFNALQVKYAYAITCHKAQGGQWDAVFIDVSFLSYQKPDKETLRWLYTAITRAKSEVYFLNLPFEYGDAPEDF